MTNSILLNESSKKSNGGFGGNPSQQTKSRGKCGIVSGEQILKKAIKARYQNVIFNYRPPWLTNPLTGKCLEIDLFVPEEMMGIEFQDAHHRRFYQSYKDEIKKQICINAGIMIYRVWPMQLRRFVQRKLKLPRSSKLYHEVKAYMDWIENTDSNVRCKNNEAGCELARRDLETKFKKWFTLWKRLRVNKPVE